MLQRARKPKVKAPKAVAYQLIPRDSDIGAPMYRLLEELVETHHEDLREARIAIAWNLSWKPDVDGRVTLGKCKKASDLDRELADFDFIILLRKAFWTDFRVTDPQRRALLDHELHHAAVTYDEAGEPVYDERGRKVYRIRKHDVEEFTGIVERYGLWTSDLERMAVAFKRGAHDPFVPCADCKTGPAGGGWRYAIDDDGNQTGVERCPCWVAWSQARKSWGSDQGAA